MQSPLRFDRNEWAGSCGDLGTDLPLLIGMALAAGLDGSSVFMVFGALQVFTALVYRMPMPVQPLKAMAAIVIAQKVSGDVLFGGGLAIGILMLFLTVTGLVDWLVRVIPVVVVRGIQMGLGIQLASIALKNYVRTDGWTGYGLAAACFLIGLLFMGDRRMPAALLMVPLGFAYSAAFSGLGQELAGSFGVRLPSFHVPEFADVATGFLVLALPQLPLSLGNSVVATKKLAGDLFPDRPVTARKIGFTYSLMNLAAPFLGGVPVCHGCGGMAGHYAFGARTGGSVVIYGTFMMSVGLFFGSGAEAVIHLFPLPVLGILLLFEALALILLVRDVAADRADFTIAALVALASAFLPYGYLIGLLAGTLMHYALRGRLGKLGGAALRPPGLPCAEPHAAPPQDAVREGEPGLLEAAPPPQGTQHAGGAPYGKVKGQGP